MRKREESLAKAGTIHGFGKPVATKKDKDNVE